MTPSHIQHIPVRDDLLVPLLESAADTLRSLDSADVPHSLRHIHGFDRRGLLSGPGRRQLMRAIESDDMFRALVIERFCARDEVQSTLEAWVNGDPNECVDSANARRDLALLASTLYAARPEGAEFGLGLVAAQSADARRVREEQVAARAADREIAAVEEARRRADLARMEAETDVVRVTSELQKERSVRRAREERATADANLARLEVERLTEELAEAVESSEAERLRATREAKRARALEEDVKRLRAELESARTREGPPSAANPNDIKAIAAAAAASERLTASLRDVERRMRGTAPEAPVSPPTPQPEQSRRPPRPRAPARRTLPTVPRGMIADSPTGIEAMLRTPDVMLVIDGYNVTNCAWPGTSAADQRERLGIAVTALHRRLGCGVLIAFDGDGSVLSRPSLRRGGVRVLFSDANEEADEVVVREVGMLPKRIPVVVASSDAWVREHAEREGAVVVSADALRGLLRVDR